jgi:DNA helicase INO80
VSDSGKLHTLDGLLTRLKNEGHRVLIYSQMTRMIDLLEEFMCHRKHKYIRLDGSSKIHERRDMVADFQQRSDIFVFLLSTRAGGLGINLTAADTVIPSVYLVLGFGRTLRQKKVRFENYYGTYQYFYWLLQWHLKE